MKKYELLLVLPGTLDEKEAEVKSQEILELVKKHSEEAELTTMGKNRLAYPVKQIRYGYFYTVIFQADAKELKKLQDKLNLMRDLLRAVISVHNPNWAKVEKISYVTSDVGLNTNTSEEKTAVQPVVEVKENKDVKETVEAKKIDMKDIDKKLDEILDGGMITGV